MTLNEIFPDSCEFMNWLAHNCYSCDKLQDDPEVYNNECELENLIAHSRLDKEIDAKFAWLITEKAKLCKCKNFAKKQIHQKSNLFG